MTTKLRPRAILLALLASLLTSVPARADVILSFDFGAVAFGENPQLFTFGFSIPYSAGPFDTLTSEFTTSVIDLDQSGAVNVVPADASGFMLVPDIDGVDVLTAALGTGCNPTGAPGFTATCDPFSTTSVSVTTLANGVLAATVSFVLSGGSISGEGRLTLSNTVVAPEPGSLLLLGLGAGAVAARRRRARQPLA